MQGCQTWSSPKPNNYTTEYQDTGPLELYCNRLAKSKNRMNLSFAKTLNENEAQILISMSRQNCCNVTDHMNVDTQSN